jgi:hypothetical protein
MRYACVKIGGKTYIADQDGSALHFDAAWKAVNTLANITPADYADHGLTSEARKRRDAVVVAILRNETPIEFGWCDRRGDEYEATDAQKAKRIMYLA